MDANYNPLPSFEYPSLDFTEAGRWEFKETLNLVGASNVPVADPYIADQILTTEFTNPIILVSAITQQEKIKWIGNLYQLVTLNAESIGQATLGVRKVFRGSAVYMFNQNVSSPYRIKLVFNKWLKDVIIRVSEYNIH